MVQFVNTSGLGSPEEEEDTRETEAVRQREYLERVTASQKHQLRQAERLHKLTYTKMLQAGQNGCQF